MSWPSGFFYCTDSSLRSQTNPPSHSISSATKGWAGSTDTFCRSMLSKRRENPSPAPSPSGLDLPAGGQRRGQRGNAPCLESTVMGMPGSLSLMKGPHSLSMPSRARRRFLVHTFPWTRSLSSCGAKTLTQQKWQGCCPPSQAPPVSSPQAITHIPPAPARLGSQEPRRMIRVTWARSITSLCSISLTKETGMTGGRGVGGRWAGLIGFWEN